MSTTVVVGGGIAGMLSAIMLRKKGDRVVLVERDDECGGLLRSHGEDDGLSFDFGTHFGRETGLPELDEILYGDMDPDAWHRFQVVRTGNYNRGELDEDSLFIKADQLPADLYQKGVAELMACEPFDGDARDLDSHYRKTYGNVFTDHLFRPPLEKLFCCPARDLDAGARHLFGLSRMRVFSPEITRELKKSPFFDDKLAFHHFTEGQSGKFNYYPKRGGIGEWCKLLVARMEREGVEVLNGQSVDGIEHDAGRVRRVTLSGGETVDCERMIWTVPPALCLRAAQVPFESAKPRMLSTILLDLVFDRPFATGLYYFVNYEPQYFSYRTTLYPNVGVEESGASRQSGPYHCTVEVVHAGDADVRSLEQIVPAELRSMGIVREGARILKQSSCDLQNCIPVMTCDFSENSRRLVELADESFENIHFLGKAGGLSFFIHEVLIETYRRIQEMEA